jgi:transcriptional regulator with GAF, ATPase, and Fis domain
VHKITTCGEIILSYLVIGGKRRHVNLFLFYHRMKVRREDAMVKENGFFKRATMRICGSLEIEVALWHCLFYLRDVIPADIITIHLNERGLGALRTIARADISGGRKLDDLVLFPSEARSALRDIQMRDIAIINDSSKNPLACAVHKYYGDPVCSALVLPLVIDKKDLGGITLRAYGRNKFTDEHANLFLQLKGPFAIALSNTLKHQEIVEMKEVLANENQYLRKKLDQLSDDKVIGHSSKWKAVLDMVNLVGPLDCPVLLLGETGVGKEIVANAIHSCSLRKDTPFIKINCGALPEGLLDSALFGHEKGAFTGAVGSRKGFFERADQGTIFLDEIGEMPAKAQVRLLRIIQNKELERVGGTTTIPVDARIITACQHDLQEMVNENRFRADLWFRLNVFPITIPPLKERKEDIPALVQHFIKRKAKDLKMESLPRLSPGAIDTLMAYDWPGNVRELENVVERAVILSRGAPLDFRSFSPCSQSAEFSPTLEKKNKTLKLDQLVKDHIQGVLETTHGKIYGPGGAAEILGINANTLRNRMNKLGIPYKRLDRLLV